MTQQEIKAWGCEIAARERYQGLRLPKLDEIIARTEARVMAGLGWVGYCPRCRTRRVESKLIIDQQANGKVRLRCLNRCNVEDIWESVTRLIGLRSMSFASSRVARVERWYCCHPTPNKR